MSELRNIVLDKKSYLVSGDKRYAAVYARHYAGYAGAHYETPDGAAEALEYGEDSGELSASGIYDMKEQVFLVQRRDEFREGYRDDYFDWREAVALEVPVRVVEEGKP